jgi:hypothetical protein
MPISRRRSPLPLRTSTSPRRIEVALDQDERLLHAQSGAPEYNDQSARPSAVAIITSCRTTVMISSTVGGSGG